MRGLVEASDLKVPPARKDQPRSCRYFSTPKFKEQMWRKRKGLAEEAESLC